MTPNSNSSPSPGMGMKPLTPYGRLAETQWQQLLKMVAELEAKNLLQEILLEAENQTGKELDRIQRRLMKLGPTPQQSHDRALRHYLLGSLARPWGRQPLLKQKPPNSAQVPVSLIRRLQEGLLQLPG